ncbi:MAG: hypothetical protein AAF449_21755, partial [Myxococcota bacterium]
RLEPLFAAMPDRTNAYHRLHDLLAEAGDTTALAAIVGERIAAIDDGDELARLFYEKARLDRTHGDMEEALVSLENLAMLDEAHVGGIALAIEINVALKKWPDAVEALRALSAADVPDQQRRIALLGAADFLDGKMNDPSAAFDELRKIEALGLADASLYERMAVFAEKAERTSDAVDVMLEAADRSRGATRASHLQRAGALQRRVGDRAGALLSFRQALSVQPTDLECAEEVASLMDSSEHRRAHAKDFLASVQDAVDPSTIDERMYRKLLRASEWLDDRVLREAVLEVVDVLDLEDAVEKTLTTEVRKPLPNRAMSADERMLLAAPSLPTADYGAALALARAADETLAQMDGLDLSSLGVGRRDLVPKDDRVRELLETLCRAFGVEMGEVYRGGENPLRIVALAGKRDRTDWVVGGQVRGSLGSSHRTVIGAEAFSASLGLHALGKHGPRKGETMLAAACAAAGVNVATSAQTGLAEWTRAAEGAMSRRARKAIAAAGPSSHLQAFCEGLPQWVNLPFWPLS